MQNHGLIPLLETAGLGLETLHRLTNENDKISSTRKGPSCRQSNR